MGLKEKYLKSGKIVISVGEEWKDEEEDLKEELLEADQGSDEDLDDEDEDVIVISDVLSPEDLAVGLVSTASSRAKEVSSEVSSRDYIFAKYLSNLSSRSSGLPTPFSISHSHNIKVEFSFKYNNDDEICNEIVNYIKEFFDKPENKRLLGVPEDAEVDVKFLGTDKCEDAIKKAREKLKISNLVFPAYILGLELEKDLNHYFPSEKFLGVEIKHSEDGDGYRLEITTSDPHLPGFSLSANINIKVIPFDEYERTSYFYYPADGLSPVNQALFNLAFYVSLLDFFFGYKISSNEISPVYYAIDKDYLYELYSSSGRLENDSKVEAELPVFIDRVIEAEREAEESGKRIGIDDLLSSGEFPGIRSLLTFIKRVWSEYAAALSKDKKRVVSEIGYKDVLDEIVASLLLLLALSTAEHKSIKGKALEKLTGKPFSKIKVGDLAHIFSRIAEKAFLKKFKHKPLAYINEFLINRTINRLYNARESKDVIDGVYRFLYSYLVKTISLLRFSGAKELVFRFTERAGTAYASRGRNSRGEDIYALAFNPYFFVRNSIVRSLDLDVFFSTILLHEFAHVRLGHLRKEISIAGHEKFISEVPEVLSDLVPEGLDNIHEDVYINYISVNMAKYFAKAKFSNPAEAMDQERRIRSYMLQNFYFSDSVEDYNLPQVYVSTNTGSKISGGIVSGSDPEYARILAYRHRYKIALPNVVVLAKDVDEAISKYLYKDLGKKGSKDPNSVEDLGGLFYKRDQIGIGFLLKVIAIIVKEAMSPGKTRG
jgi:hypothetical protein